MLRWLLLCLLWPSLVMAEVISLAWDYDLALQPSVRYILRISTTVDGQTYGSERPLNVGTADRCQLAPDWNAETLCSSLCLGPGEYSLTVSAVSDTQPRSPESNVLDVDLTMTTPCQPAIPVPPPPQRPPPPPPQRPPSSPPTQAPPAARAAILAGAAAAIAAFPGGSVPSWLTMVNFNCVQWAITGPCLCTPFPPTPCLRVEYWEPGWLVETVKNPGQTIVPVLGDLLPGILASAGLPAFGGGAAANATGTGAPNLHFHEAHVYTFPQFFGGPCTACAPSSPPPTVHYASEIDPRWRMDTPSLRPADLLLQIGVWARFYPRGGKVFTSSEPVSSGVCATRAMDIAFNPVDATIPPAPHVVLTPTGGMSTCLQLAHPVQTPCFSAGTPPPLWETGTLSVRGTYLWIVWRRRSCCVPPSNTTCGITLPALGRHGANGCVVPSTP